MEPLGPAPGGATRKGLLPGCSLNPSGAPARAAQGTTRAPATKQARIKLAFIIIPLAYPQCIRIGKCAPCSTRRLTSARATLAQIEEYLGDILPYLDIDANGEADVVTYGPLIMQQLITPTDPQLIKNAVVLGVIRVNPTDVRGYVLT